MSQHFDKGQYDKHVLHMEWYNTGMLIDIGQQWSQFLNGKLESKVTVEETVQNDSMFLFCRPEQR